MGHFDAIFEVGRLYTKDVHKKEASLRNTHVVKSGKLGELAVTIHVSVSDMSPK